MEGSGCSSHEEACSVHYEYGAVGGWYGWYPLRLLAFLMTGFGIRLLVISNMDKFKRFSLLILVVALVALVLHIALRGVVHGYMWIGTEYGLNRFDGYHFRKYFKDVADTTSLCDNEVNSFLVDQKGRLWVGTRKGLVLYDYANDCFVPCHFPDGITPRIQAMEQINSGEIIVGTAGYGLFVVKEGDGNLKMHWLRSFTKDNTDEFVSRLFIDDTGNIWRGSHVPNTKCYKVKNLNPQTVRKFPLSCGPMVSCVKDRQNSFLMVCMYGILRYDVPTATFTDAGYDLSALDGKVSIRHACLDNSGNLYLGTSGHGAMVIPKGQKTLQPVQCDNFDFDLASSNVNYIFEDRNHNIWISCYGKGLYQISLNPDAFSTYSFSSQNIRIGSRVSSITSGKESGDVWHDGLCTAG